MDNSTVHERWHFLFRHEFISCVYLRRHGFDQKNYNKKIIFYLPLKEDGHCTCGLDFHGPLLRGFCEICDSSEFDSIHEKLIQ